MSFHTSATDNGREGNAEPIVRPEVPVVDSHMHLWNLSGFEYFAPEYLQDIGTGHNVEASVYIECGMRYSHCPDPNYRTVGETDYVLQQIKSGQAAAHQLAAGIIGSANLLMGEAVRPVLEAHIRAGRGRFRGIRARVTWDPDPLAGYHGRADFPQENIIPYQTFLEGARCVEDLGLVLETWGFHPQLQELRGVAAQCPSLKIVLNHLGGPLGIGRYAGKRDEVFRNWSAGIHGIAELPNVHIKLSGVGVTRLGLTLASGSKVTSSDDIVGAASPYIMTCIEAFGPDRCIFGSNYPVDKVVAPYGILLNAYKKMLLELTDDEYKAVFSCNARRLYNLQ
jgi:L-fuconolactonase